MASAERPLNLLPHEARAARDGSLAMVWRPVVPQPEFAGIKSWERGHWSCDDDKWDFFVPYPVLPGRLISNLKGDPIKCPLGPPGTLLWCKETWADVNSEMGPSLLYKADGALVGWEDFSKVFDRDYGIGPSFSYKDYPGDYVMWWSDLWRGVPDHHWRRSTSMPKWASRTTLRVVSVVVKRVGEVTEEEARAWATETPCAFLPKGPCQQAAWSERQVFSRIWTHHYAKRYPWPSAWAWGVGVRVGGGE